MRLNKRNSRIIAVAVIILFFVLAQVSNRFSGAANKPDELDQQDVNFETSPKPTAVPVDPESQFELNDFRRSSVKNGVKQWEVVATRGTYNPQAQQARLYESVIEIARPEQDNMQITSNTAVIDLTDNELVKAQLAGQVIAKLDQKTTLFTEQAEYNVPKHEITSQSAVRIQNEMFNITAQQMLVDTESQIMTLTGQVNTVISPAKSKKLNKES